MKQDVKPSKEDIEMEDEIVTTDNMTTDIVEDFARELDRIVSLQDAQSEEDDDDEQDTFGYQQLPQDEDEMYQQLPSDEEEEEEDVVVAAAEQNPLSIELDASNRLDPETSDWIKSIMTNVQLSNDAIPEWAKKIPESAWLPRVNEKK